MPILGKISGRVSEMGVVNRIRKLTASIKELGVIGTIRQRFGRVGPEFQILAAAGEEVAPEVTPTATPAREEVGKKKIRGL
jgi:hypothetical protein